jgi:hypothetical protein
MMGQGDTLPSPMSPKEDVSRGTTGRKSIRNPLWIPKRQGKDQDARIKRDREMGSIVAMDHFERGSKEAAQMNTKVNRPTACHNRITRLI